MLRNEIPAENKDRYIIKLPIFLCIYTILYIAMIVVGFLYETECPLQPLIPFYLKLQGILGLMSRGFGTVKYFIEDRTFFCLLVTFSFVIYLSELIIFILGSIWVYSIYSPNFSPEEDRYCHKGTYLFAFCYLTIMYCLLVFTFLCGCCIACADIVFGSHIMGEAKKWQVVLI
ncbi:hypothetical protein HHI36_011968 [Cryptolaemus montrouzieri]|uniref:Uncharacterized protein n=1 Tax=Cryptolaemus montrouzieri TaxID=559131 RepID=A0ABD2NEF2_9CUCU